MGAVTLGWLGSQNEQGGRIEVVSDGLRKIVEHMLEVLVPKKENCKVLTKDHPLIGKRVDNISHGVVVAVIVAGERDDPDDANWIISEHVCAVIFTQPIVPHHEIN